MRAVPSTTGTAPDTRVVPPGKALYRTSLMPSVGPASNSPTICVVMVGRFRNHRVSGTSRLLALRK